MEKQQKKVYLDLNHAFGSNFSQESKNEIGIIQEDNKMKVVYTIGKSIVKQSIENHTMEFIKLSENVEKIQCIAISPSRNHIAVCEKIKNENFLLLNLYGLKTRDSEIKHFKLPQTEKQSTFKIISFSPSQPKYACCMTGEPDSQLMFLDISRSRGLAVSNFSVEGTESISICPTQSHLISCAGKNIFKLFKVEDYSFKAYEEVKKLPKQRNFIAHSWFDKTKILIGTDRGQLFMVGPVGNNFEVKRHLGNVFSLDNMENSDLALSSICVFSKGFILGSNKGHFSLWMKRQQNEQNFEDEYTGDLIKKWQVGENKVAGVVSIAMCPHEENMAIAFNNNSIAFVTLSDIIAAEEVDVNSKQIEGDILHYLYNGFHNAEISSMDICLHRPIFATLSKKENTIRVWNYKHPNCQLIKKFDAKNDGIEELSNQLINCLALHPLGYYIAVGCCDKLRIYHILESELRNYREIVLRNVCQLKFANGGQFLAAAYPRQKSNTHKNSIHLINIYNSYTLEEIGRLSDHANLITDLCWRSDDKCLYSVGIDGQTVQWKQSDSTTNSNLGSNKNQNNLSTKQWLCKKWNQSNSRYTSVMYEKTAKSVLASGIESNKSIIRQYKVEKDQVQKLFTVSFKVSKLHWFTSQWNIASVLAGTEDGCLKVFNSAFDNIVQQSINIHRKQITNILTSPCGRYVITSSKDGIIFIYQVSLTSREGYVNKKMNEQVNDYEVNPLVGVLDDDLADVVLVQRNDVNEKCKYNKILQKKLDQMKRKLIVQDDDEKRKYEEEAKALYHSKDSIIQDLNQKYQKLRNQKKQLEIYSQTHFSSTQNKNEKMLQDIETLYEKKLAIENKKYFELEGLYEKEKIEEAKQIELAHKKTNENLELLKKQFIDCFKKAEKVHYNQQNSILLGEKEFNEKVNQLEDEHEHQLKKLSEGIIELQTQKNKKSIEYITNIQSLKRQCKILTDQIIRFMSENQMLLKNQEKLITSLEENNSKIRQKRQDLIEKQQNLKIREQKIGDYQERISDLQKKKEVLSYRTWEMRQQIQPKEDQIQFLKEEIFNIEKEFQKLLNDEKTLKQLEIKLKKQKEHLSSELSEQKVSTKDKKAKIKKICDEINAIVQSKNSDRKYYEAQIKSLYEKYGKLMTEGKRNNQVSKGIDEMQRHKTHIDKEIVDANKRTEETIRKRDDEIQKATQQNADLIKELTDFREEKSKLMLEFKNVVKISDNLKRQTIQMKNMIGNQKGTEQQTQNRKMNPTVINNNQLSNQGATTNFLIRSNSQPVIKGKISKGVNYDSGSLSIFTKAKLKDLQNKLENAKLTLRQKEIISRILKEKIIQHISSEECSDPALNKIMNNLE